MCCNSFHKVSLMRFCKGIFYLCAVFLHRICDFFFFGDWCKWTFKTNKQKTIFWVGILQATKDKSRIRIRSKISRIHNTACMPLYNAWLLYLILSVNHLWWSLWLSKSTKSKQFFRRICRFFSRRQFSRSAGTASTKLPTQNILRWQNIVSTVRIWGIHIKKTLA